MLGSGCKGSYGSRERLGVFILPLRTLLHPERCRTELCGLCTIASHARCIHSTVFPPEPRFPNFSPHPHSPTRTKGALRISYKLLRVVTSESKISLKNLKPNTKLLGSGKWCHRLPRNSPQTYEAILSLPTHLL